MDPERRTVAGGNLGIQSFDPRKHVRKERADTISMWIVIAFASSVALIMRYAVMPGMNEASTPGVLWVLPLLCIGLLPSLHRSLPEHIQEHYTRGTWFRAAFLHTFTWLCVSFLMINPPFGDIAPPEVEHVSVLSEDGDVLLQNVSQTGRITVMIENGTDVRCHLLLSLVDNRPLGDLESMDLNLTLEGVGTYVTNEVHLQHLGTLRASSGWNSTFTRTLHPDATAVAVDLGNLSVGEYALDLNAVQQGDPWQLSLERSWTLVVVQG